MALISLGPPPHLLSAIPLIQTASTERVVRPRHIQQSGRRSHPDPENHRIAAEAASDEEPAYETNTARGIAANRRAEIFVEF